MDLDLLKEFLVHGDRDRREEGRIGRYQIVREIGRGGTATVYEATDPDLGRRVAVKVLREGDIERVLQEAKAVARLRHANIVTLHEVGPDYIVMEFVAGPTLAHAKVSLSIDERVKVLETVARAVDHAHRNGVVHRDLKPGNVMIEPDGRVVLTDFGLAKITGGEDLTMTGGVMGTPRYMAPEQIQGKAFGPSVDIWALGVILYELISDRHPFEAESPLAIYHRVTKEDPQLLPGPLGGVAATALEKNPRRRFASAGALADELARYLRGEAVAPPRWRRRLRGMVLPLAAAAVLGGAFAGVYLAGTSARRARDRATALPSESATERKYRAIEEAATASLERNPRSVPHLLDRSGAHEARADYARDHGKNPLPIYAAAEADATLAIEIAPRSVESHLQRGRIRSQRAIHKIRYGLDPTSDCDGAEQDLRRAMPHPLARAWLGNLHYHRATWMARNGSDVRDYLKRAERELTPAEDADTLMRRGRIRAAMRDFAGAEEDYLAALAVQPTNSWTWARRGEARREAGDLENAEKYITHAIELDRFRADPFEQRGHVYFLRGDHRAALADYEQAVKLNPSLSPLLADRMRTSRAATR